MMALQMLNRARLGAPNGARGPCSGSDWMPLSTQPRPFQPIYELPLIPPTQSNPWQNLLPATTPMSHVDATSEPNLMQAMMLFRHQNQSAAAHREVAGTNILHGSHVPNVLASIDSRSKERARFINDLCASNRVVQIPHEMSMTNGLVRGPYSASWDPSTPFEGASSTHGCEPGLIPRTMSQQLFLPPATLVERTPFSGIVGNDHNSSLLALLCGRGQVSSASYQYPTLGQRVGPLYPGQQVTLSNHSAQAANVNGNGEMIDSATFFVDAPQGTTIPMEAATDKDQLSPYQALVRRQLEFFVSQKDDAEYSVQGRKKQARLGQVGIRCKHCSHLPHRARRRGAGYYPTTLSGVYQAAQNMATNHLKEFCTCIPSDIRTTLLSLRGSRQDSSVGGGKQYWADACVAIGLVEEDGGLRFHIGGKAL